MIDPVALTTLWILRGKHRDPNKERHENRRRYHRGDSPHDRLPFPLRWAITHASMSPSFAAGEHPDVCL